ncbi:hypothetical protein Bbelb_385840 [Branchiostoma belcheri]|nr:hypothetical protein Bbelb_385840 [Branchiostoma belcheri]
MQSETPVKECTVCLQEMQRQKETEVMQSETPVEECTRCRDRRRQKIEVIQSETPVEEWTGCLQEMQRQKETEREVLQSETPVEEWTQYIDRRSIHFPPPQETDYATNPREGYRRLDSPPLH